MHTCIHARVEAEADLIARVEGVRDGLEAKRDLEAAHAVLRGVAPELVGAPEGQRRREIAGEGGRSREVAGDRTCALWRSSSSELQKVLSAHERRKRVLARTSDALAGSAVASRLAVLSSPHTTTWSLCSSSGGARLQGTMGRARPRGDWKDGAKG